MRGLVSAAYMQSFKAAEAALACGDRGREGGGGGSPLPLESGSGVKHEVGGWATAYWLLVTNKHTL